MLLLKKKHQEQCIVAHSLGSSSFCNLIQDVTNWYYREREGAAEITGWHFGYLDLELHGYESFRLGFSNSLRHLDSQKDRLK